jgi:hypothetical protein
MPEGVKEFMILTEFRVANVTRLGECPHRKNQPSRTYKDFP